VHRAVHWGQVVHSHSRCTFHDLTPMFQDTPTQQKYKSPSSQRKARTPTSRYAERAIAYETRDYLELVDWSGRAIIEGKRGTIPDNLPPILDRLKISPENYIWFVNRPQKSQFHGFIGTRKSMRRLAQDFGRSFLKGQAAVAAAALFSPG